MIEKNNNNSSIKDSSQLSEKDEKKILNFKLLYRNAPNSERDKGSGVSSDEETTSSSLVPIPETLKQIKNKSRWTVSESGESPDLYGGQILEKSAENIMSSLEELRKKYTLKNESSVALKMNSANMMLDDILSSANLKKISNESMQPKFFKEQDFKSNTVTENESSTTEISVTHTHYCPHILNHSHIPTTSDFFSPQNHQHCSAAQPLYNPPSSTKKEINPQNNQKKKSLIEKLHDLQIRYRIQSVYKAFRKTKSPFAKNRSSDDANVQQGIPGADYQGNLMTENEPSIYKFEHSKCPLSQYPKKMILDLVEFNEMSQFDSKNTENIVEECQCTFKNQRERCQCMCKNQREKCQCTCIKQKDCNCPEIIPKCDCIAPTYKNSELFSGSSKQNSSYAESLHRSTEEIQLLNPGSKKKEDQASILLEENKTKKQKKNSLCKNSQGWKKYCSKERNVIERTDIYYFDHGNSAYYQTTDNHPMRYTECLVERTDEYATRFWAEIFGTIEIGIAFLISFILQLYRFLFTSIIRSLTVGLLQIFSDYFFKPFLTILFNGIIQPCLILAYNIAISVRDLCLPISQTFGFFTKEVANILRSCRFVEVSRGRQSCYCGNKVGYTSQINMAS